MALSDHNVLPVLLCFSFTNTFVVIIVPVLMGLGGGNRGDYGDIKTINKKGQVTELFHNKQS